MDGAGVQRWECVDGLQDHGDAGGRVEFDGDGGGWVGDLDRMVTGLDERDELHVLGGGGKHGWDRLVDRVQSGRAGGHDPRCRDTGTVDSGDTSAVNLGVEFSANVAGSIAGIRFYKARRTRVRMSGRCGASSGTLLAQGTFTNETASGWQTLVFSSPVPPVAGNTTYVASYLDPSGHYSDTASGLASAITNGPLTALATGSVSPGNGVYAYATTSTFPTSTYNSTNYWVDVLFVPAVQGPPTVPGAPTGVSAAPASSQALVSWTAPASNGGSALTGYKITVTPAGGSSSTVTVGSGSATSQDVTGLQNGTSYTFSVAAVNTVGTGSSTASSPAIPEDTILDVGTPATVDSGDKTAVDVGVRVQLEPDRFDHGDPVL